MSNVIQSNLRRGEAQFEANAAAMRAMVVQLRERSAAAAQGGTDAARERHRARGKLLARERIDLLLDPGSAFLELSALAAYDMYGGEVPGAGMVTGIGRGSGCEGVVVGNGAPPHGGPD